MKTISIEKAKGQLGKLLKRVKENPVIIEKNNKPVAVLLSVEEYEHFEKLEDIYWAARADEVVAENDWMGPEKSKALLRKILSE